MNAVASKNLVRFTWLCLVYTVFVIVWGAYVRASGSGAGCGSHWPLCNGTAIPATPSKATLIEFSHRLTSGLSLVAVAAMFFWVRKVAARGTAFRRAAKWSFVFILAEAGVGAVLVLQRLVADDSSLARAVVIALHLVNTMFLTAAIAWTALEASTPRETSSPAAGSAPLAPDLLSAVPGVRKGFLVLAAAFLLVGASGAIVALGDTLFPASSLVEGMRQDLSSSAHFLVRLRVIHPFLAVALAVALWVRLGALEKLGHSGGLVSGAAFLVRFFLMLQVLAGVVNWLLMAPHWLQLLHLGLSNALWVSLVALIFGLNRIAKPGGLD
ncbi:MAG: Heme synthase [Pseudomonadota bacterium]